ncbi:MAG: exosome 3'-_5 exonuclease subunit ski4 (Csl4) [Alyxoria varia]|nr:MAG: exosome 3'->5 exonuclease subunit ski4 (Csl4) [Alyxoria varia]
MTTADHTQIAIPGQSLGSAKQTRPGQGTHIHNGDICASVAGEVVTRKDEICVVTSATSAEDDNDAWKNGSITNDTATSAAATSISASNTLPCVNATVLARVTRTTTRQAHVSITVVDGRVCADNEFPALIRVQDVRATEKDSVKIGESFRPGDVVRGVVISLGDQSNYYLSTASNHLGVVLAKSESGNVMFPVSWREFCDPVNGKRESRKVAKPYES